MLLLMRLGLGELLSHPLHTLCRAFHQLLAHRNSEKLFSSSFFTFQISSPPSITQRKINFQFYFHTNQFCFHTKWVLTLQTLVWFYAFSYRCQSQFGASVKWSMKGCQCLHKIMKRLSFFSHICNLQSYLWSCYQRNPKSLNEIKKSRQLLQNPPGIHT